MIVFIVNSGRSGSMSLANALGKGIVNCHVYHGPNGPKYRMEKENCLHYHFPFHSHEIQKIISSYRLELVTEATSVDKHYIEVCWYTTAVVKELTEVFPKSKVFHLVRDGRDFVRSGLSRPWFTNDPDFQKGPAVYSRDKWNPPKECETRFEKICWLWAEQQRVIKKGLDSASQECNGGVIRFEDLLKEGAVVDFIKNRLNMTCRESELDFLDLKIMNNTNSYYIPHWTEWDDILKEKAERWMGDELQLYGYTWKS